MKKNCNIHAIIQARMGSTRLPGKVMIEIASHPILFFCIKTLLRSKYIQKIIVATTERNEDNIIADWCLSNSVDFFRGKETDVLDRFYKTATFFKSDLIIRITSDNPLNDITLIDLIIIETIQKEVDFGSNMNKLLTWPYGLGAEIFTYNALQSSWEESHMDDEREHVTLYIKRHPEKFTHININCYEQLSHIRLTVDYPKDLELNKILIEKYHADELSCKEIVSILYSHPELLKMSTRFNSTNKGLSSLK